jgi:hypothetical protein
MTLKFRDISLKPGQDIRLKPDQKPLREIKAEITHLQVWNQWKLKKSIETKNQFRNQKSVSKSVRYQPETTGYHT